MQRAFEPGTSGPEVPGSQAPVPQAPGLSVAPVGGGLGLIARRQFEAGDVVLQLEGLLCDRPSRTSIQISEEFHLDAPQGAQPGAPGGRAWQFFNHCCDPNTRLVGPCFVATACIQAGDEVTFDYNTTEYEIAVPFDCACQSPSCRAEPVRGFAHLPPSERERLAPFLSGHLERRMAMGRAAGSRGEDRLPAP